MAEVTEPSHEPTVTKHLFDDGARHMLPDVIRRMMPAKELPENIESQLESFAPFLLDRGLMQPADYVHDGTTLEAPPVAMLGRSGTLNHLEELLNKFPPSDFDPEGGVHLAILDVAQLRNMNYAGAGDYGLNRVAARLQEKVKQLNDQLAEEKSGEVAVGRIGGDEFMLIFYGISEKVAKAAYEEVINTQNGVQAVTSYYKDSPDPENEQTAQARNVRLKDEPFVTIPSDENEREIMLAYLKKGIILERRHFTQIANQPTIETHIDTTPDNLDVRLDRIVILHPELADVIGTIQQLAKHSSGDQSNDVLREGIDFIEGVVYDRLLGENVRTFDDLMHHAVAGDLAEMYVFDFKGLKELNDKVGLVAGDEAIQATFASVVDCVRSTQDGKPDDTEHAMYFRRGGTIVVAGRRATGSNTSQLSDGTRNRLMELKSTVIREGGEESVFALGTAYAPIHALGRMTSVAPKTIGIVLDQAESSWYVQMVDRLATYLSDDDSAVSVASIISPPEGHRPASYSVADFADHNKLLREFLSGKRRVERLQRLAETAGELARSGDGENMQSKALQTLQSVIARIISREGANPRA